MARLDAALFSHMTTRFLEDTYMNLKMLIKSMNYTNILLILKALCNKMSFLRYSYSNFDAVVVKSTNSNGDQLQKDLFIQTLVFLG